MRATVIGGAMIDTIAIIDSDRIEKMSMANADSTFLLLEAGRKIDARDVSTHTGGGAVNVSVALSRLGFDVTIIAKLGNDERASMIVDRLRKESIDTTVLVYTDEDPTGASVLIASHEKDAAIFTYRGANVHLNASDIPISRLATDLVYVAPLSNSSADMYPHIVKTAKTSGAFVAANPGIRQISARGQKFRETLPLLDVLILNRKEAEGLLPLLVAEFGERGSIHGDVDNEMLPHLLVSGLSGGGYDLSLVGFFCAIARTGTKAVAVTDSGRGSFVGTLDGIWHCPTLPLTVAGTAGAGDAFGATFVSEMAFGSSIENALKFATTNAAFVVCHVDTQSGLQDRTALETAIATQSNKLEVSHWTVSI